MNRGPIKALAWSLTALYWTALFTSTHLPPSRLPHMSVSDKFLHFTSYTFLAMSVYVCLSLSIPCLKRTAIYSIVILWTYGAIDELLQIPVGRTCDIKDWLADATGTLLAVLVMTLVRALWFHFGAGENGEDENAGLRMEEG